MLWKIRVIWTTASLVGLPNDNDDGKEVDSDSSEDNDDSDDNDDVDNDDDGSDDDTQSVVPKGRSFTVNPAFSNLPYFPSSLSIRIRSMYLNVVYHLESGGSLPSSHKPTIGPYPVQSVQSLSSYPTSLKSFLIPIYVLVSPKVFFPSGLATNTLYAFLDSLIRAKCPAHLKRLDLMFLIMSAPNIFLRTLFSNTLNLCSSLKVVVITEDVQDVHLLLEYRPHIDVSLTCEHDPKLQEYCVCPQNMPQFDSEGIPNQAPETNKPMILNDPTSRNREGSDQETFDPSTGEPYD
ncbi:hypothetical protein ANN_09879 [Periplaneta americana]|uniref:Uncharacterized protein n=1 Tax=Periplaneta americana TaxID=6978 RepID=A0ABQ8TR57_PERAM|nr:hypothetical protein ANN_09879 [Periplaneta americana]